MFTINVLYTQNTYTISILLPSLLNFFMNNLNINFNKLILLKKRIKSF